MRAAAVGGGIGEGAEDLRAQGWPPDIRVICRGTPAPGAQLSLFHTHAGWRHTCFITNTKGKDVAVFELRHWGHASRRGPGPLLGSVPDWPNLPFDGFCANTGLDGGLGRSPPHHYSPGAK